MLNGSKIMCPWHAWEFDCATGLNEYEPDDKVAVFPVKVEGQEVLIDVA
jgi:nitrite reductase (NADH) small subunit